jgi:hypothetical protein
LGTVCLAAVYGKPFVGHCTYLRVVAVAFNDPTEAVFLGKQRFFLRIAPNTNHQFVKQRHGSVNDVDMAHGYGIERAGKQTNAHVKLFERSNEATN